jgi:hypothetical protein
MALPSAVRSPSTVSNRGDARAASERCQKQHSTQTGHHVLLFSVLPLFNVEIETLEMKQTKP